MRKTTSAYFGHHKAGTTWIIGIIQNVCSDLRLRYANFHSPKLFDFDLRAKLKRDKLGFFSYTNADIRYVRGLDRVRGFHVVRDPRDIVVSAYFSHLHSHSTEAWPELAEHRQRLRAASKGEGLLLTIEFLGSLTTDGVRLGLFDSMNCWDYTMPNVMEIKFEDLIHDPRQGFLDIFRFLELKNEDVVLRAVERNDFCVLSGGRSVGQEDARHHFRKGVPGDWRNHFQEEHVEVFKSLYNDLLIRLGYEQSADWQTAERHNLRGTSCCLASHSS